MGREVRIGLVGAGWMGKIHSMAYRMARTAYGPEPAEPILAAVADVSPERAQQAMRDYGYQRAAKDWQELVNDPQIDVIDICTPNFMHFDVAMAAIAAGKHVYCEKPLANSVHEARQMAEAAKKKGVITIAGFNFIQNPVHALALKTIQNGEIGEIKFARLFFNGDFLADPNLQHSWRNDKRLAGSGVIGDIGAHCFSYFRHLVGKEIDQVFCDLEIVVPDHPAPLDGGSFRIGAQGDQNNRIPNTTDDVANVLFKFPGGSGVMENSRISAGIRYDIGYDLIGTKGSLRYTYDRINDLYINRETGPVEFRGYTRVEMGPSDPRFAGLHPVSGLGLGYNDYKAIEAHELLMAIGEERPAYPDFEFAYQVQRVVDACQLSHEKRSWVKIDEVR